MTKTKPEAPRKKSDGTTAPFYFAEECGLVLMQSKSSRRKFWMDRAHWSDLVSGIQAGWSPRPNPSDH